MTSLKDWIVKSFLAGPDLETAPMKELLISNIVHKSELYLIELEQHMDQTRPNGLITQEAYWFGYRQAKEEVLRFLRSESQ